MSNSEKMALENYRAADRANLLVRLPVPLGTDVWKICNNPAWNSGVESAEKFLFGEAQTPRCVVKADKFTVDMIADWGNRIFPTKADARSAL